MMSDVIGKGVGFRETVRVVRVLVLEEGSSIIARRQY